MDLNENIFNSDELLNFGNGYSVEPLLNKGGSNNNNNNSNESLSFQNTHHNKVHHDKVSDIFKDKAIPASLYFNSFFQSSTSNDNTNNKGQLNADGYIDTDVVPNDLYEKLLILSSDKKGYKKKITKRLKEKINKENKNTFGKDKGNGKNRKTKKKK